MIPMGGGGFHFFMGGPRGNAAGKRPSIAMYRRLLVFVRPYRWNLAFAAILLIVSTALGLVWPQVVRQVLDLGLKEPGLLDSLVVVLIVVLLVRAALDGVRSFVMAWTGEKVIFDLRMAIVTHLQSLSLSFFNQKKTGDLMSHVTSDATLVHGIVTQTIIQVLGQVLTLVGGVAVIFVMNWRLALLTLVVAPPIGLIGQYLGRRIRDVSRAAQDAQGEAVGVLQEAIAEVRVVQAFTREQYEANRFHEKLMVMFQKSIERSRISSIMFPAIGFLGFASSIVVLWYGGHQVAAGKTTLVNLVGRFYDPVSGRVCVDGRDIREVTMRSLREQIAVVPQEPILFGDTIRENIRYGRLDATDAEIEDAARSANATEFIGRMPKGMETIVGERGVRLSVGQRQRVAIARAILRDARILLLDEATSSLDNESEFLVQQALDRLMRGRTTIVIAHRLSTVERADRILVLDRGRIVEEGTHAELLTRGGLYHRLYTRNFVDENAVIPTEPRPEPVLAGEVVRIRRFDSQA